MILKESLSYKYNTEVEAAYIITLKGHELSETMSQKCQESCKEVGMNYVVYDAFDGTKGEILIPEHSKDRQYLKWIKQRKFPVTRSWTPWMSEIDGEFVGYVKEYGNSALVTVHGHGHSALGTK